MGYRIRVRCNYSVIVAPFKGKRSFFFRQQHQRRNAWLPFFSNCYLHTDASSLQPMSRKNTNNGATFSVLNFPSKGRATQECLIQPTMIKNIFLSVGMG